MDRDAVIRWVDEYEQAWRTPGTDLLAELFTPDATYLTGPFAQPLHGLGEIAPFWERERTSPGETFAMTHALAAVDAERRTAVVRVEVAYGEPVDKRYRDLWVLVFAPDGRVRHFEEWWAEPDAGGS